MASPMVRVRLPERVHARVLDAAAAEGLTISGWLRRAALERLGDEDAEARERAELLKQARAYLAIPPKESAVDRDAFSLVERYVRSLEATTDRISAAEARGRQRALVEIAAGALVDVDGQELSFGEFSPDGPPVMLETTTPRRRGFLKASLAAERAAALLKAVPPPSAPPSAAGLLGWERTAVLWDQALRGALRPAWGFCRWHGMVPLAELMDGRRTCYLGCTVDTPEVS